MIKPTLLIVDDEADIRSSIAELVDSDFRILESRNGAEALSVLDTQPVDLVITDYNMPGLDGLELVKTMQEKSLKCPVVVLTGRGNQELRRDSWAHNVYEYVEKPFHPINLRDILANALSVSGWAESKSNFVSRAKYTDIHLRLPKDTATALATYALSRGLSVSTFIDTYIRTHLLQKLDK